MGRNRQAAGGTLPNAQEEHNYKEAGDADEAVFYWFSEVDDRYVVVPSATDDFLIIADSNASVDELLSQCMSSSFRDGGHQFRLLDSTGLYFLPPYCHIDLHVSQIFIFRRGFTWHHYRSFIRTAARVTWRSFLKRKLHIYTSKICK
jgi:hypothetical protein